MRSMPLLAAGSCMVVTVLFVGSAGQAADVAAQLPIDAGTVFSVQEYADDYGVSTVEAERRLALQVLLDAPIADVVEAAGDRLAGFGIRHEPYFGAFIFLTGDDQFSMPDGVPSWARELIEVDTGFTYSIDELLAVARDLPQSLRAVAEYVDVDTAANRVEVGVSPAAAGGRGVDVEAYEDLAGMPITLVASPGEFQATTLNGGLSMTTCTSGFKVRNSANTPGISTAGHCQNSQTLEGVALTYAGGAVNADMDVQWHTAPSPHTFSDDFYNGSGYIDVGSVISRANSAGDYVCHRGKNSGTTCGTVTSIYHAPPPASCGGVTCNNVWIRVEGASLKGCEGDSGGPFYNGNQAYGTMATVSSSNTTNCSIVVNFIAFTSSTYYANIGITIATS